jgi:SAM-dependent methyltransferase
MRRPLTGDQLRKHGLSLDDAIRPNDAWSVGFGMEPVDYNVIAPAYDQRYRVQRFDGIRDALLGFLGSSDAVAEIACGTGFWLGVLRQRSAPVIGLDPSAGMMQNARRNAPQSTLVQGEAESLPFRARTFDRLFCINAIHHFKDAPLFAREAYRTLRPGGGLLTIGLDPHTETDHWWIYDYFPEALIADRKRYRSTAALCDLFQDAGFVDLSTRIAQHIPAALDFEAAVEQGFLDRRSTSQLQVIRDQHWEAGLARLQAERPVLRADLRLYATSAWHP